MRIFGTKLGQITAVETYKVIKPFEGGAGICAPFTFTRVLTGTRGYVMIRYGKGFEKNRNIRSRWDTNR